MEDQAQQEETKDSSSETQSTNGSKTEAIKAEVSAQTIGRMMGLATISDLRLMDSKLDLVTTKVSGLMIKLDKVMTSLNGMPTAADMERIEVQVGSVKTSLRDTIAAIQEIVSAQKK